MVFYEINSQKNVLNKKLLRSALKTHLKINKKKKNIYIYINKI